MIKLIITNWKIIVSALLLAVVSYQTIRIKDLKAERDRQEQNANRLLEENYTINFEKSELKETLTKTENEFLRQTDSVLKAHDIKVKHLNRIIQNKEIHIVRDTTYLAGDTIYIKDNSLYTLEFSNDSDCISATVRAITKDPNTKLNFTELINTNESYYVVYKEDKPWWRWFKKRKLIMKTISKCGDVTFKELKIEDNE